MNMNKELTPLEALWKLYTYDDLKSRNPIAYLLEQENLPTYYKIIEKALKRLEIIDRLNEKHYEDTQKKLKALEIIKEKGCLQFCMLGVSLEDYNKSVDSVNKYKYSGMEKYKHYTQEEFDLLKEVLK